MSKVLSDMEGVAPVGGTLKDEKFLFHLEVPAVRLGALVTILKAHGSSTSCRVSHRLHGHAGLGRLCLKEHL